MLDLILNTAQEDQRIRAVILNGSRANPNARRDIFQDYDVVYIVTDVASFTADPAWIDRFGERMILQLPDTMGDSPPPLDGSFAYLIQLMDGNRIDVTLYPVDQLHQREEESLRVLLLDKDRLFEPFPESNDRDYLPRPPSARAFADCCNEFWWVALYVAKGLWREEITYAKQMMEGIVRPQLMQMLTWHAGINTHFTRSLGKSGKYLRHYLDAELWTLLEQTYADADYARNWDALLTMTALFRRTALTVAAHQGFTYPQGDDERVSAHLHYIRDLPADAVDMY